MKKKKETFDFSEAVKFQEGLDRVEDMVIMNYNKGGGHRKTRPIYIDDWFKEDGEWHHVAISHDGKKTRTFIDGVEKSKT